MEDDTARGEQDLIRDEDDHDLLTFSESGIRLREEIAAAQAALREHPTAERRAELEARLQTLTDALVRNTRQASAYCPGGMPSSAENSRLRWA